MAEYEKTLVNDVIYYLHIHNGNSSAQEVINACMIEYEETQILDAKTYLLTECIHIIKEIDQSVATDINTARINSNKRCKKEAVIKDIIKAINVLEGSPSKCCIEFQAVDTNAISKDIPETLNVSAILDRLEAAESNINAANSEIIKLKSMNEDL